jgi:Uma2 family endonuclease
MATAATIPGGVNLFEPMRLLTVADVAALPSDLPSGAVRYELNDGRLVVMAPPGADHGGSQVRFSHSLFAASSLKHLGEIFTEVGLVLRRNPDRLVVPDLVFITSDRVPPRLAREGYLETIPDLVLEIRSKNDTTPEVESKTHEYLRAGVRVVWVADPATTSVTEYRLGQSPRTFAADDELTLDDLIPGFAMKVREGFR